MGGSEVGGIGDEPDYFTALLEIRALMYQVPPVTRPVHVDDVEAIEKVLDFITERTGKVRTILREVLGD